MIAGVRVLLATPGWIQVAAMVPFQPESPGTARAVPFPDLP
jgi:hypothetical protein